VILKHLENPLSVPVMVAVCVERTVVYLFVTNVVILYLFVPVVSLYKKVNIS
jgi:hypothetical protein